MSERTEKSKDTVQVPRALIREIVNRLEKTLKIIRGDEGPKASI